MSKVFECMNAADLPITKIDEAATLTMYIDDIGSIETVIQIKVGNETVRIHPATISVSLERSIASDLWKAYYLPMYYQVSLLRSIVGFITRTTYIRNITTSGSMTITYRARNDNFTIEYQGKEYILSADSKKVTLRSKHPIKLLESPVFKVDSPMDTYNCYAMTVEVAEFIGQLSTGNSIFEWLQSIMGHAEEREKFLEWYKRKKK
nr:MAG TPA: hypothetical protein [Caudoviricetes sp.]DAM68654.1 MAG TPA: hypothetical protein [Caudoviricetes sp.]DAQ08195.1 MAG TPA: hypothetical protein [Caudoviricetes sp.]